MAVHYTTAAIVKKRVKYLSSSLSDSDIEENISQVEDGIDAVMTCSFKTTFDPDKHGIIRNCATDYAAYLCISYDPAEFPSMETAEFEMNVLWNNVQNLLTILSDTRTVEYLKGL